MSKDASSAIGKASAHERSKKEKAGSTTPLSTTAQTLIKFIKADHGVSPEVTTRFIELATKFQNDDEKLAYVRTKFEEYIPKGPTASTAEKPRTATPPSKSELLIKFIEAAPGVGDEDKQKYIAAARRHASNDVNLERLRASFVELIPEGPTVATAEKPRTATPPSKSELLIKDIEIARTETVDSLPAVKGFFPNEVKGFEIRLANIDAIEAVDEKIEVKLEYMVDLAKDIKVRVAQGKQAEALYNANLEKVKRIRFKGRETPDFTPKLNEIDKKRRDDVVNGSEALKSLLGQLRKFWVKTEVERMDSDEVKTLPVQTQIDLLESLENYEDESNRKVMLKKLYASMPLDPAFKSRDSTDRQEILNTVRSIKDLQGARDNKELWKDGGTLEDDSSQPSGKRPDRTSQAKIRLLQKAVDAQRVQFGIPYKVDIVPQEPKPEEAKSGQIKNQAHYDHDKKCIFLVIDPNGALKDFDTALNTVMHEMTHGYQNYLIDRVDKTENPPGRNPDAEALDEKDERYGQAKVFLLNDKMYIRPEDDDEDEDRLAYNNEPMEKHAFLAGAEAELAFRKGDERFAKLEEQLNEVLRFNPDLSGELSLKLKSLKKITKETEVAEPYIALQKEVKGLHAALAGRWNQEINIFSPIVADATNTFAGLREKAAYRLDGPLKEQHDKLYKAFIALRNTDGRSVVDVTNCITRLKKLTSLLETLGSEMDALEDVIEEFDSARQEAAKKNGVTKERIGAADNLGTAKLQNMLVEYNLLLVKNTELNTYRLNDCKTLDATAAEIQEKTKELKRLTTEFEKALSQFNKAIDRVKS
jgi:hypothetical protein